MTPWPALKLIFTLTALWAMLRRNEAHLMFYLGLMVFSAAVEDILEAIA